MTPRANLHVTHIDALVFVLPERAKEMEGKKDRATAILCIQFHPFSVSKQAHKRVYSNSASLRCSEPKPICSRRINSGRGNSSAAKFYSLKTTLAFHSLAVCLFLLFFHFSLLLLLPPAVLVVLRVPC